jgi:hypothetical protein
VNRNDRAPNNVAHAVSLSEVNLRQHTDLRFFSYGEQSKKRDAGASPNLPAGAGWAERGTRTPSSGDDTAAGVIVMTLPSPAQGAL